MMGRAKKSKHQRNRLLKRVLGSPRGRGQALLAIFGFVLGLTLLLGSLNLSLGIHRATRREAGHSEYLIVNKQVTMTGMLTYIRPTFTESEIEELREQPFVQDVGEFTSNRFRVSAVPASVEGAPSDQERTEPGDGVGMELPLYTDLFFESVPDRFLDVQPDNWEWSSDSRYLPIIMSREFLNLYNFAFALAQGLPQIPESMLDRVGGRVTVSGKGGERTLQARVVGLSDRIPSIIVPADFMRWANLEIAEEERKRPSRLIIKTDRPADPAMLEYFQRHNLQVNSERLRAGRVGRMAMMGLSVVGGLGGFFVVLALFLFVLLSRLILAESAGRIRLLLQLGYSPAVLTAHALRRFWISLISAAILAGGVLAFICPLIYQRLRDAGFDPGPVFFPATIGAGILILLLTGLANLLSVRRAIYRGGEQR